MRESAVRLQVESLLRQAIARTHDRPALSRFRETLRETLDSIGFPMRVAIAGLVSAGKSTMLNALLGEEVLATATLETTYNVSWLKHGRDPYITIHFKDRDRRPEKMGIESLKDVTRRFEDHEKNLRDIEYVDIFWNNEFLRRMELIDTPGLSSFHGADSENTLRFLKLHGDELTRTTQDYAIGADAVIYLFRLGVSTLDRNVVEELRGPVLGAARLYPPRTE